MKCSDCIKYNTSVCTINPRAEDWDMAESYSCFTPFGGSSKSTEPLADTGDTSKVDTQRIYEEERARATARESIQREQTAESGKKLTKGCLIITAIIAVFVIIIAVAIGTCDTETTTIDILANVSYKDGQFTITNKNSFDWHDVKLYVNTDYTLRHPMIEANTTYTVGSMQFAKDDGTMFNPFTMKPVKFTIRADTPDGKRGWWSGGW